MIDLTNRIKQILTEATVATLLRDAGYKVEPTGIEHKYPDVKNMKWSEYRAFLRKKGIRLQDRFFPDFCVLGTPEPCHIEVKYRSGWDTALFRKIFKRQVTDQRSVLLVLFNADPPSVPASHTNYPSTYLRCCSLRLMEGRYEVEIQKQIGRQTALEWRQFDELPNSRKLWEFLPPLQRKFQKLADRKTHGNEDTITLAVQSLSGILRKDFGKNKKADRPSRPNLRRGYKAASSAPSGTS